MVLALGILHFLVDILPQDLHQHLPSSLLQATTTAQLATALKPEALVACQQEKVPEYKKPLL